MGSSASVLITLALISPLIAAILGVAWHIMDRPAHARSWAMALLVASASSVASAVYAAAFPQSRWLPILISVLGIAAPLLLLRGFEQRLGSPRAHPVLLTLAAIGLGAILLTAFLPSWHAAAFSPAQLFRAVALLVMTRRVAPPGRRPRPEERLVALLLLAFALLSLAGSTLTLLRHAGWLAPELRLDRWIMLLGLPALFVGTGASLLLLMAGDLADKLRQQALTDSLTGILNRRAFEDAGARAVANARRFKQPLTLAIGDLDYFKTINDRFGHAAGDRALVAFSACVAGQLRRGDIFARIGGEEFAILLINTPAASAAALIERIRDSITRLHLGEDTPWQLTASFGVSALSEADRDLSEVLHRADAAVYQAKVKGRNRVACL